VQLGTVQLLPLGNSIAYVQPVYVQAAGDSTFPRLTFLAAFANDRAFPLTGASASIAVEDTINNGASNSGNSGPTTTTPTTTPTGPIAQGPLAQAIKAAADAYQADTRAGNYAQAGQDLQHLLELVAELPKATTGTGSTGSSGSTSTTAPKSTTTAPATTTTVVGGG
jgi:hypothetical protein